MFIKKVLKIVNAINLKVCYISMVAIFVLMLLTTVNVIVRKLGIWGVPDAFDMTNLLMILIVFCALAYQESVKEHIRVDMLVEMLPNILKHIVNALFDLLTVGTLGYFSYAYYTEISRRLRSGAASQILKIPEWPFCIVVAVVSALFALTVLLNMIDRFLPKDPADSGEAVETADAIESAEGEPEENPS